MREINSLPSWSGRAFLKSWKLNPVAG